MSFGVPGARWWLGARRPTGFCRGLLGLLLLLPATLEAQRDWVEVESDHFVAYTDSEPEKGARLLNDFEARYAAVSQTLFPLEPRDSKIAILLVSEQDEFRRFLSGPMLLNERSAYLFRGGDAPVVIARDRSPKDIVDAVGHSLGHLLLARSRSWQPFWLQEGVGEYVRRLGTSDTDSAVDPGDRFPIDGLLTIVPSAEYDDLVEGSDFRTESYHLLRVLIDEYPGEFKDYFAQLGTEAGSDASLAIDRSELEAKVFDFKEVAIPLGAESALGRPPGVRELNPDEANQVRGDFARAAGARDLAGSFYRNSPLPEARVGQAVLRKLQSESASVRTAFELLVQEHPESGWAHYHFGTLQAATDPERAAQTASLEQAVRRMPWLGRAYAELGYMYVLAGRPEDAMPLVDRAIELEPEFSDRFFVIRAEAWLILEDYARARETIRRAELLPHANPADSERYALLVPQFEQKIDAYRREREALRVEALRRRVEALVEENDPAPVPVPEEPAPIGRITYSVSSSAASDVVQPTIVAAPMPDYTGQLRRDGFEGRVVLDVALNRRGEVVSIEVTSADDLELAAASVAAVRQWMFEPARQRGVSVRYDFRLTLRFYLE